MYISTSSILLVIIILAIIFSYGVGVGKFSWPPHDLIRFVYKSLKANIQLRSLLKNGPYILITFDDGNETDYTVAYPLMKERDIKGTSYITTSWIGENGYLNWEQVKELSQAKWTLGCHTHTHPFLAELNDEQICDELLNVNRVFGEKGLSAPLHHAYPYGDHDARVLNIIKLYRKTARSLFGGYLDADLYRLKVYPIYIQNDECFDQVKQIIRYAMNNKLIIVLLTHDITENPSEYGTHPVYFEKLLDYIVINNYNTATISEMYDIVINYNNV